MRIRDVWSGRQGVQGTRAREFVFFVASMVIFQGSRFLFLLAAAHALAPKDFTAWALVVALLVYAPSLLFGITNGMSRELPILIGQGREEAVGRSVAAAWTATFVAILVILAGAIIAAAAAVLYPSFLVGFLAAGTIVLGTQQFILRSRLRFDAASAQQATHGAFVASAAVPLVVNGTADFSTVAALYGAALLVAILIGFVLTPPTPPQLDIVEVRRLAKIGFPILLVGLVFSLFVTLDRWIATTLFGPEAAAPYALASLIASAMLVVPTVVSQQTYPRMAIARGTGAPMEVLRSMARHQGLVAAALVAPVAVAIALFAWIGVPRVLPAYADAGPAVVVLSVGFVVLAYLTGYGNYLNVVGGQWRYLAAQLVGLTFAIGLMFVAGRSFGLLGIAFGMSVSHVMYGLVLREVAMRTDLVITNPVSTGAPR